MQRSPVYHIVGDDSRDNATLKEKPRDSSIKAHVMGNSSIS